MDSSPTSSSSSTDLKPATSSSPVTSPKSKKRVAPISTADTSPNVPEKKAKKTCPAPNGEWTDEKRAVMMDTIIAAGYKAMDLDVLASKLGLSKRQVVNQLQPRRKGSLRDKAVLAVRGGSQ